MSGDPIAAVTPPTAESPRREQFAGCLLGQALGDALGAPYEGLFDDMIDRMGPAGRLVREPEDRVLRYTDDTQMLIGVAEVLAERGAIDPEVLGATFARHYDPDRGYGTGARRILQAIRDGGDWRGLAGSIFPGGSLGNGAAMRAAPVGLLFADDLDRVAVEAERSAEPTHTHPIGVDGARLIALGVALALRGGTIHRRAFFDELLPHARTEEFQWQLRYARRLRRFDSVAGLGNGLEAHRSVTTALAIFVATPDDFFEAVGRAVGQGNDTDTLAAMTGALVGARLGVEGLPADLLARLENGPQGRRHLIELADRLFDRSRADRAGAGSVAIDAAPAID